MREEGKVVHQILQKYESLIIATAAAWVAIYGYNHFHMILDMQLPS